MRYSCREQGESIVLGVLGVCPAKLFTGRFRHCSSAILASKYVSVPWSKAPAA